MKTRIFMITDRDELTFEGLKSEVEKGRNLAKDQKSLSPELISSL